MLDMISSSDEEKTEPRQLNISRSHGIGVGVGRVGSGFSGTYRKSSERKLRRSKSDSWIEE